ncbi:LexA family protein [Ferruginibacter sp.]|nr:translesion error-prone DNA polymerase V autoproteolytic subunit [Ferruginibacter sp.]
MEDDFFFGSGYKGTKQFTQHDVPTANASGFGAAADDYMERGIDLNEQLIMNKPATFFFRMNGEAMTGAGIQRGDVLIVDRSIKAANGKTIVAVVDGDMVVRRYFESLNKLILLSENEKFSPIEIGEYTAWQCWGVVTCVIHIMDNSLLAFLNNAPKKEENDHRSHISKRTYK